MCGIAGAITDARAPEIVLSSLRKLEYRGYDSAGLSFLSSNDIITFKESGKIDMLAASLPADIPQASVAVGHTRWATHGKPSKRNSHPHQAGSISLVHNGIISNADELRKDLSAHGIHCISDTDTEVVAHLINAELMLGRGPLDALQRVLPRLEGSYALAFIETSKPDMIFFARMNSPLIVGRGSLLMIASDTTALDPAITEVCYPEDGDHGLVSASQGLKLFDQSGTATSRPWSDVTISADAAEKGRFDTFMMKEIVEQPRLMRDQIFDNFSTLEQMMDVPVDFHRLNRIHLSACGTAYYACEIGARWFRELAGLDVRTVIASEAEISGESGPGELGLLVSQSGETADTLAVADQMRASGMKLVSLVNVSRSSLERASHATMNIGAGPEIGVASTKAFTAQLLCLLRLAIKAGLDRDRLSPERAREILEDLNRLPGRMEGYLRHHGMARHAKLFAEARSTIFLGKGAMVPLASEAALKLKECSYIHAQGYPAGELKHGPIALVEDGFPVVCLAPRGQNYAKMISAMEEVTARGARALVITDDVEAYTAGHAKEIVPSCHEVLRPFLYALPVQLLAHHVAEERGLDVDRPRNLAKSVTVQ